MVAGGCVSWRRAFVVEWRRVVSHSTSLLFSRPQPPTRLHPRTTDRLPAAASGRPAAPAVAEQTDCSACTRPPVLHSRARRTRPPPTPTHKPVPRRLARAHSPRTAYSYSQHAPTACARYTVLRTRLPAPDTPCWPCARPPVPARRVTTRCHLTGRTHSAVLAHAPVPTPASRAPEPRQPRPPRCTITVQTTLQIQFARPTLFSPPHLLFPTSSLDTVGFTWATDPKKAILWRSMGITADLESKSQEAAA